MSDQSSHPGGDSPRPWLRCFALGAIAALTVAGSGVVVAQSAPPRPRPTAPRRSPRVADRR